MGTSLCRLQKFGKRAINSLPISRVYNRSSAGLPQQRSSVSVMRSKSKNRFGKPQIFENFCGDLMIAASGLEQKQAGGVRSVLQRFPIGQGREQAHNIF